MAELKERGVLVVEIPASAATIGTKPRREIKPVMWANQPATIMFGYCRISVRSLFLDLFTRSWENRTAIYHRLDNNIIICAPVQGIINYLPLVHFDLKMIKKSSWKLNISSRLCPPFYFYVYRKFDAHF